MSQTTPFHIANSVLLVKLRAIGDVLLSTPVAENLKKHFPNLNIDFLCEEFAADVLRGNPHIDSIVMFNKKNESSLELIQKIRSKKYDVVIDLFGNPRTALITRLSGAKDRIGFPFRGRKYAYNYYVEPRGGDVHNIDFNLDVLRSFQLPIISKNPIFPLDEHSIEFARHWLGSEGIIGKEIIGINPSGGWGTKRWNLQSFADLIEEIIKERGSSVLIFWGPGEYDDAAKIQKRVSVPVHIIPKTTLKEMGALLKNCSSVISNDSGPMHIAASLGVPTLGIYGPTNPLLQGPFGDKNKWVRREELDCLACNLTECPIGNVCMKDLSVLTVLESFRQLTKTN